MCPEARASRPSWEGHDVLRQALRNALGRVSGDWGCDSSCYGCLRSYRNQFAHTFLNRKTARTALDGLSLA